MTSRQRFLPTFVCATLLAFGNASIAQNASTQREVLKTAAPKIVVSKEADLPRFSYPIDGTATRLVESDSKTFAPFAASVGKDIEGVLARYQIDDRSTLSHLLASRLNLQELAGDYAGGLQTIERMRALEEKPAAKLLSGLFPQARLQAAIDAGGESGPAYEAAFRKRYAEAIEPLPWDVVQDSMKAAYGSSVAATPAVVLSRVGSDLDPAVARSGGLDAEGAATLLSARVALIAALPVIGPRADVLRAYIAKRNVPKPEIWSARELTLTDADKLTPVNIAIWDSGVDVTLFANQLFTDPMPTSSGAHGLAYDDQGNPSTDWTFPISAAQKAAYPRFQRVIRGRIDLQNGIDSADARLVKDELSAMSAQQMRALDDDRKALGHYVHGTHCAGIAVRGNPAARLVVARFNDQLPAFTFAPTEAWVRKLGADFQEMADYFRTRRVRVVNMSWSDDAKEFETWLSKTGGGADAEQRQQKAAQLFALWRASIANALASAPDTLFIAAAGNSDSDAGFTESVPSSLKLPNLITVGAVNKAGDETSFTSHGDTVLVHADGYQVVSLVPGGERLPLSGTSMAAPNVANLAAKLIALDPTLTPAQTIRLIRDGSTATEDGRLHLIDEKRSAALLKAGRL